MFEHLESRNYFETKQFKTRATRNGAKVNPNTNQLCKDFER